MKTMRRFRHSIAVMLTILLAVWQIGQPLQAATLYWDADATAAGNNVDGTGLGGTGTWDTSTANWWNLTSDVAWPNTSADKAIFTRAFSAVPVANTVTLAAGGVTANQLRFERSGYTIASDTLTLSGPSAGLYASVGESAVINSRIAGSNGLTMDGGGWVRLGDNNNSTTLTGATTINHGALVITGQGALPADSSAIVVTRINPAATSTSTRGFGGGSLVLDGTGGNVSISRNLTLFGHGPWADRGAALVSTGVNTLSGTVDMSGLTNGALLSTRIIAADGTLNLTGTLNVQGTAGTTISNLGGVNQAGASFYNLTGALTGTGTLEASGGGTLFLDPSNSSGFSGVIRVSGSAASGQSVVRIDSPNVLGTRTSTGTGSVVDMNGGVLAVLMDSPSVLAGGAAAHVYGRASSTFFADHTPNSSVKNQTVTFGQLAFEDNITLTFNSRNGYGMTFAAAPVVGTTAGDNDNTMTNNLQGGALLTFTGNFWSNGNNTANRTMTIGGNGNTLISGNIIASAAAFNHNLVKSGSGTLTISSTGSTLDGNVSVNGGTVAITDWRSITNNTSTVNLNGGILSVIGNNVSQTNLTTSKVINLSGTTGSATILANQTGTSPGLALNADFTASGAGVKTLTLGGTNTAANTISGAIVNNSGTNTTALTKIDGGRWVLAGVNTYTGATTISNGTLQVQANAASSTVLADTSAITFNATNVYAGGTLEFLGQASVNNIESLGALTPTAGAGTVKLTPGSGGTASLVFSSLGTVNDTATINITGSDASNTVTITGQSGLNANPRLFFGGSNFAIGGAGGVMRAPVYGTDAGFVNAPAAAALPAGADSFSINGNITAQGSQTVDTLKVNGGHTLTLSGGSTLTVRTGAANTDGAILQTGGNGTITGGTGITTGGTGSLTFYVDGGANTLSLQSALLSTLTGGITKSGAGTLRLEGANAQTGTITINEGTIRLAGSGTLGGAAALTIRQDGILELNGITPTNNVNAFNNNGIVRNTSATTDVVLTVGGANGTGDSRGIIEDGGAGKISVVKIGTGGQNWLGLSTYTGTTTIGSTGIVGINNLQNGGQPSGIGASSNAAGNLIFNGTSTTQAYGGISYTGTTNDETDRLFTLDGGANGGVRIQSNGVNQATSSWTNTGAIAFGANATGNPQGIVFGGASTGDNRFFPIITDNGGAATSVYKADAGIWYLEAANTYTGPTTIRGGALYVTTGTSLPTASNLVLDGGSIARTGAFTRTLGTGANQVQWAAHAAGGFSAGGSPLTVDWGSGAVWGTGPFLGTGALLLNNSGVAKSEVDVVSGFEITQGAAAAFNATTTAGSATVNLTSGTTVGLAIGQTITGNANIPVGATIATIVSATQFTLNSGTGVLAATGAATNTLAGGYRQINVGDFTSVGADFGTISGVITGAGSLAKEGAGILNLRGANTYTGQTLVRQGTLVVETLGNSASPGATSVGGSALGNTDAGAIALGNGGTTAGILEYVGLGETSDRKIRLNTTTGSNQIHADGVGSLILTNVANDMTAGAKTLLLRGVSSAANFITSQLSDNGGALGITVDGSTAWVLTNGTNNYTGTTTVSAGALGIGDNAALGTGNFDLSSGTIFAYGADRTISNVVRGANNTGTGVIGDYSLTFTNPLTILAGANNYALTNNVANGKTVTFAGATANSLTANRTWTIDGAGMTIINGNFTSSTTFGVALAKTGDGVLQLNGAANNFNQNNATVDIDRGTLRLGANEVIGHGLDGASVAYGSVTLSPELAGGDTATLDLNGFTETINGLTMNTDGAAVIDNTAATAAHLIFGANNAAVTIGGAGSYTITDSGAGALSITKTGTAAATIPTGATLTYQGSTNVNGGSLTIASSLNGTTALSATNATTLALTGGLAAPSAVTSLVVDNGSTLSLLDGAGNKLNGLTNLQLGSASGTMTVLNLNVGDLSVAGDELSTDTLTLLTGGTLGLFAGNKITFNLTDIGLNPNEQYVLLDATAIGGGLFGGPLNIADYLLGGTPGGFSSIDLTTNSTTNQIILTTGNLILGTSYWRGLTDNTWNAAANNWSTDKAGTTPAASIPGAGTDVVFAWDNPGSGPLVTTLEQNFKINSLTFEAGGTTTPSSITINPGTITTNRIEIAPQSSADGIEIAAGGPAAVTISSAVRLGGTATSQTWSVTDAGSVLSIGSLLGERDVTKAGSGKVTLTAAADPTFNSGATSDFTLNAGTLELTNNAALGNTINSNLANVIINSSAAFYYNNGTAGTVANPITLAGGALSGGGQNHTYSGTVNVSSGSIVNLADSNGPNTNTARNVTLSGVVSGSGNLTIDGNNAVSGGNQLAGTLTMNNAGNTWSGDLLFNRGTVTIASAASPSFTTNDVTFNSFGRFNLQGVNSQTLTNSGTLTYAASAIGEIGVDNTSGTVSAPFTLNMTGPVSLGASSGLRLFLSDGPNSVANFTNGVTLGGNASISVGGGVGAVATFSGVIGDGGSGFGLGVNDDLGAWGTTNRTVRLTGLNTFTGNVTLGEGVLEFTTVTGISGGASSLGNGTAIAASATGTLSFIGTSPQSTNRPITTSGGVLTLSANGATAADTITYNGLITVGPTADGTQFTLTGTAGREGIIGGGILQTGDTADMTVTGGTWTHQTGTSRVGDVLTLSSGAILNLNSGLFQVRNDFVVTGAGTVLNLNGTGALSFNTTTLSADASLLLRDGGVVNLGANDAVVATEFDRLFIAQDADGATATLNMNTFNLTTSRLILGERSATRTGAINGTGILTITGGDIDLYKGTINAGLGSTGTTALEKFGPGMVTLAGDNSGLASTGSSIVYEGTLALDYTSSNTTKLRAASALDMRGGNLILTGNASAATSQSVGSFTAGSGGSNWITLNPGAGQEIVLNLNALTRAVNAQDGTLRLVLPSGTQSATNGVTTDTLNTLGTGSNAILGGWLTVNDGTGTFFARNLTNAADGNIVAAVTTLQAAVTSWVTGDNISDSTGFTGTLTSANINSLRFNAASGSDLTLSSTGVLGITSGGILVTDNVAGTPSLVNGTLFSGAVASNVPELIFIQDSSQTFELGADVRINHALTKSGTGTLRLTGNNVFTGYTEIQEGVLEVAGGNAIGDNSIVTLSASRDSTLRLLSNETIGRLQGGQRATNSDYGTVDVDTFTLTINESASTTYAGFLTGTGNIVMNAGNTGNLNLTNVSTGFTGIVTVDGGLFQLSGIGQINANVIRINKGGNLLIDNNGTTRSGTRILDTTAITLNSADGAFSGQTRPRGLAIRTDQDATLDETVGLVTLGSGANYAALEATTTNDDSDIIVSNLTRLNKATFNVRGTNLGSASAQRNEFRIVTANDAPFIAANLVGGAGAAATATMSIVPWAIGETFTGALADANMGNSLVTYISGTGFRPLDFTTEYSTFGAAAATSNARESLTTDLTGLSGKTVNALVINNNNTVASTVNVTGTGAGQTLAVTSGAMLFTLNSTATASSAHSTILGGFDSGITTGGTNEYVVHVVNPSSAATTPTLTATIASPLTSNADITKSGRGTLIFTAVNTAGGGANKTTINEGILEIADLDNIGGATGGLVFAGGILRLGAGFADDLSSRSITLLDAGGTLDTNGIDLALASSLGSGLGGFTKTGAGILTLNAAATFTGGTTVSAGTLAVGANNATGNGGNLSVAGGATLALGTNSISHALVTTSGTSPLITGAGTVTASTGFFFNHTGDTTIDAVLAGAGGVLKAQTNVVTLTGTSTYTGTTEVQAGTLSINSIANVGGGASALGAPTTGEAGIIRMGLSTTATTLQYTGNGHASNRLIGMQGTTGGVTIDADGTGALGLGGARFENSGNKTLTLRGDSNSSLVNTIGSLTELGGVLTLNKTDANTWMVNGASSYTGATQIDNGILMIGLTDALPTGTAVRIGTGATAGTLDLNGFDQTIGSLVVQTNSDVVTNQIIVDSGKTLTINGAVSIGAAVEDGNTNLNALGGGSIVVNSNNGNFIVGTATAAANSKVDVDFTGLSSFTANLGTGFFRLGDPNTDTEDNPSTFKLAVNNTITAAQIRIGDGSGGGVPTTHTLTLGSGTNILNTDTLNIGSATNTIRSGGAVVFDPLDTTGMLTVRASDGSSRAAINIINTSGSTGADIVSNVDLTGHSANILASTLTMAARSANVGNATATLTFNQGTLDTTTLNMASRTGTGSGAAAATVNLGGGTTIIGTLGMAVDTSTGTPAETVTADLNVTGGTVTIGTGSGTAINMANAGTGRAVTSNINLTGGTATVTGNVVRTGGAGTENATVTLNGASLNMSGNSIGAAGTTVTLAAQSGTLTNLAELNGGSAPLTKSTAGVLSMGDGNVYTGGTFVNGGTLLATNTTGSATGSGSVNVGSGTILGGTGSVVAGAGNHVTIDGTFSTGLAGDMAGQDMALTVSSTGNLTFNGTVSLDIFANAGGLNLATANDRALITAANWSNILFGGSSVLEVTTTLDTSMWADGDAWQIFDWTGVGGGMVSGTFAAFNLPALTGKYWDYSNVFTTGVISISNVPEPSRALFMLMGLLGLISRRRRQVG